MGVGRDICRMGGIRSLVSGLTLFGLAGGCAQDPAFIESTKVSDSAKKVERSSSDAKASVGVGTPENDAGGGPEGAGPRVGAAPSSGKDPLGNYAGDLPGVDADGNPLPGAGAGAGMGGGSGGSVVGSGGPGGSDESGGSRGGLGENPRDPGEDSGGSPVPLPTAQPTPVATVIPTPLPELLQPKPGAQVVFDTTQGQGKVDVLWVVDDSGSMEWAQEQLREKFEAFAQKLTQARVDFRVGVTSTDVCDINWTTDGKAKPDKYCPNKSDISPGAKVNGVMIGPAQGRLIKDSQTGSKVLSNSTPNFVQTFGRLSNLGTVGSGLEHGLTAARMAIEKAKSGVNADFLRNDAFLSVIVLSDEEDDGIQMHCEDAWGRTTLNAAGQKDLSKCKKGGNSPFLDAFGVEPYALTLNPATGKVWTDYKFTADTFKSYLDDPTVKGPGKFRVSAITGLRGTGGAIDCSNPDVPADSGPLESGTNYIKAAQLTGGVVENICSPEWSQILGNIGQNVGELANKIALPANKVPFPGTLEVWVDGVKQPQANFAFESQGNFLVFKVIPASGAAIKVKYLETVN
jgi:hypothetical protein